MTCAPGTEFFQRREVKDVLAYARLVENPRDEAAFTRVVNMPRRGVGATSFNKLRMYAMQHGLSLLEAARTPEAAGIKGKAVKLKVMIRVRQDNSVWCTLISPDGKSRMTCHAHLDNIKKDTYDLKEGEVCLKQGDVMVQRGTNHSWSVRTDEPCVLAGVLVNADPV